MLAKSRFSILDRGVVLPFHYMVHLVHYMVQLVHYMVHLALYGVV